MAATSGKIDKLRTVTRGELAEAFNEWKRRAEEEPDEFGSPSESSTYGEECADYMLDELLA